MDDKKTISFPGNLKISFDELGKLNPLMKLRLIDELNAFQMYIARAIDSERNVCYVFPLTKDLDLFLDYRNKTLNIYIEDKRNNVYTQNLSAEVAVMIAKKQTSIRNGVREYSKEIGPQTQENNLKSTLIHSAYDAKTHNRGSPKVLGKKLADNFDLDR